MKGRECGEHQCKSPDRRFLQVSLDSLLIWCRCESFPGKVCPSDNVELRPQ
jgi:hypothetical protein